MNHREHQNPTPVYSETLEIVQPASKITENRRPIASITSPSSSGEYSAILRDYAATYQIEGSLVAFDYREIGSGGELIVKTVLCQVTKMELDNAVHKDPVMRAVLRKSGSIPGITGVSDNRTITLLPIDAIQKGYADHRMVRTIPPTGTEVRFASKQDIDAFSGNNPTLFNIGYLYETNVPVGLMLKHFGPSKKGEDDGWGDAQMMGIFGSTGSGKTVMAGSIIAGFAARHEMGMLIIDPMGQLSNGELGQDASRWSWRLDKALWMAGRGNDVKKVHVTDIAFESVGLFADLLVREGFLHVLVKDGGKRKEVAERLKDWLHYRLNPEDTTEDGADEDSETEEGETKEKQRKIRDLVWKNEWLDDFATQVASCYAKSIAKLNDLNKDLVAYPERYTTAKRIWERVLGKFTGKHRMSDLLDDVLISHKIVILNVDTDAKDVDLYCSEILKGIKKKAEAIGRAKQGRVRSNEPDAQYMQKQNQTNALIVIDEAHRFAPQHVSDDNYKKEMLRTLQDAIRTTRKLNVGWCYVTQSIADFDRSVFRQLGTKILGVGIGSGADNDYLDDIFNKDRDLIAQYRRLPLPRNTKVYPYAIIGQLVGIGNGTRAFFIAAPRTQEDLFRLNPNHFKPT